MYNTHVQYIHIHNTQYTYNTYTTAAAPDEAAHAAAKRQRISASLAGPRTKVLLLRNMVGPGQVDDALEDEVGEECSKYGNVNSVFIFEATAPGFPPEEAVRIFVEFDSTDAATKVWCLFVGRGGRGMVCVLLMRCGIMGVHPTCTANTTGAGGPGGEVFWGAQCACNVF